MDREILRKWLKAGYLEKHCLQPTEEGAPQGSPITPPTKWQNAPILSIGASHKRVRWDAEHDVDLSVIDFDAADQGANDLASGKPVGSFESVLHLRSEVLQAADQ
jgi:hypothetical protein